MKISIKRQLTCILLLTALLVLLGLAQASSRSLKVETEGDTWYIFRESSNMSFTCEQSVQGQISPVDYRGRTLSPYHSYYEDVNLNDVRVRERTAALAGNYSSAERLRLVSSTGDTVSGTITKPSGSNIYTISYYEIWPVGLSYAKSMSYVGRQINNREFVGNNGDYIGTNFLYNQAFSKDRRLLMILESLNATVLATDAAINLAEVKATRDTQYRLQSHSTGIASFRYLQAGAKDGEILNAGEERFAGTYDMIRKMRMKSNFTLDQNDDDWLPCCAGGYASMTTADQETFWSARGVFDCTCFQAPGEVAFQR